MIARMKDRHAEREFGEKNYSETTMFSADVDLRPQLDLSPTVVRRLRTGLPRLAEATISALTTEVAAYDAESLGPDMTEEIRTSVELALATFLTAVTDERHTANPARYAPALEGAYRLGRREALAGRSVEALLAAYRVGARIAWQHQSQLLVHHDVPADTVATFAELVFTYIDQLSAASVAGHGDGLATSDRTLQLRRERLALTLLRGGPAAAIADLAAGAQWPIPGDLTAVVLASAHANQAVQLLDEHTLRIAGELAPGLPPDADVTVLLVPDVHHRQTLHAALRGRRALVGPTRRPDDIAVSFRRILNAMRLMPHHDDDPLDTEQHLVTLVVGADPEALDDLRAAVLQPLDHLPRNVRLRLLPTLRSWILHQGRRSDVAAALGVHPQTIRYRMKQLREHYGDRLDDPNLVAALTIALAGTATTSPHTAPESDRNEPRLATSLDAQHRSTLLAPASSPAATGSSAPDARVEADQDP